MSRFEGKLNWPGFIFPPINLMSYPIIMPNQQKRVDHLLVEHLINEIIDREGGYVDHNTDRGGPTKYGITAPTLTKWIGRQATVDDVKAIKRKMAFDIYYKLYYEAPNLDALPEAIQPIMTDMSVNHGQKNAIQMLQDVLIACDLNPGPIDGVCGPKTTTASRQCWNSIGNYLIVMLISRRKAFYHQIVQNDPEQIVFLNGWMKRADSFLV